MVFLVFPFYKRSVCVRALAQRGMIQHAYMFMSMMNLVVMQLLHHHHLAECEQNRP